MDRRILRERRGVGQRIDTDSRFTSAQTRHISMAERVEMPETDSKSENRRKKLRFRSWHRGTREMDLLLGRFADRHLQTLSDEELDVYSVVLRCPDQDLYDWVTGKSPWPEPLRHTLTQRITRFSTDPTDR